MLRIIMALLLLNFHLNNEPLLLLLFYRRNVSNFMVITTRRLSIETNTINRNYSRQNIHTIYSVNIIYIYIREVKGVTNVQKEAAFLLTRKQ